MYISFLQLFIEKEINLTRNFKLKQNCNDNT